MERKIHLKSKSLFLSDYRKKNAKCVLYCLFIDHFFRWNITKVCFSSRASFGCNIPSLRNFFSESKIPRRQSLKCAKLTWTKFFVIFLWHLKQKSHVKLLFKAVLVLLKISASLCNDSFLIVYCLTCHLLQACFVAYFSRCIQRNWFFFGFISLHCHSFSEPREIRKWIWNSSFCFAWLTWVCKDANTKKLRDYRKITNVA